MVISADGKGVVMRPDGLRQATAKAAAKTERKLKGRLSKGEKRTRKRMAEVGAVYTVKPLPRSPARRPAEVGTSAARRQGSSWGGVVTVMSAYTAACVDLVGLRQAVDVDRATEGTA